MDQEADAALEGTWELEKEIRMKADKLENAPRRKKKEA